MKKQEIKSYSHLRTKLNILGSLLLSFFISISSLQSQSKAQFQITIKNQDALSVIQTIEEVTESKYNFSHSILPNKQYSFSVTGDMDAINKTAFSVLNRNVVRLEDKLYAIQDREVDESQKIEPLVFYGTIVNDGSETLPYARISIPATGQHFESDVDGVYEFKTYVSKNEIIEIHFLGYQILKVKASDLLGQQTIITLQQESHILGEIVIKDYLKAVQIKPLQNADEIDPSKITASGQADLDAFSISQMLPGVYNAGESLTELQIRGGPPDQVSYKWNNIQLFQNSLFYGRVSAVNPFMMDKVTVNRNGASSSESGQASGSIQLATEAEIDSVAFKLHHDFLYTNIGVELPLFNNKIQLRSAYRISNSHLYKNFVFNNYFGQSAQEGAIPDYDFYYELYNLTERVEQIPNFTFSDLSTTLKIDLSPKDEINANFISVGNNLFYEQVRLDVTVDELADDRLKINNEGYSADYIRTWSKNFKTLLNYSASTYDYSTQYFQNDRRPEESERVFLRNEVKQSLIKFDQRYTNKWFSLDLGYQYERWKFDFDNETLDVNITNNYKKQFSNESFEHSAYAKSILFFSPLFKLETGVRWSSYSLARDSRNLVEPRIHFSVVPSPNVTFHLHYGTYHQNLTREEEYSRLEIDNSFWYLSNEEASDDAFTHIVQNQQYSAGAKWNISNWTFHADIYKKEIQNIWSSSLDFGYHDNPYLFTDLSIKGFEFSSQFSNSWLKLLWTYNYTDERMTQQNDFNDFSAPSPYSQPHRISLYQDARWGKNQFSVQWKYASGRLFSTPKSDTIYEAFTDEGDSYFYILYDEILSNRVRNYHRLDLSYFRFFKTKALKGKLGFHIINAYNRTNIIKNNFFIDYRTSDIKLSLNSKTGLGITPNLSLDIVF